MDTMDIKDALQEPLNNYGNNIQEAFRQIAENLFQNFCIRCNETIFYFAEIEFYYYDKDNFNKEWNKKTYPRTGKEAGKLFFHYSGFDICFESDFKKGVFGGILIRSLFDKTNDRFITGPLLCVNEMLNACSDSQTWPEIIPTQKEKCEVAEPIGRYGITYEDKGLDDEPLCFFDKNIKCTNGFKDATWDFNNKKSKNVTRYYHRFRK